MAEWGVKKENNKTVGWVVNISSTNSKETIRGDQHLSWLYIPHYSVNPLYV